METISKYDEVSLKIEGEPVVPVQILPLDNIKLSIEQCEQAKIELDARIAYYNNLLDRANSFGLKTRSEFEADKAKEIVIEEVVEEDVIKDKD